MPPSVPYSFTANTKIQSAQVNANNTALLALIPITTLGDICYASSSSAMSRLAGNTTTTQKFLAQTGNGSISAAPSWQALARSDIPWGVASSTSGQALISTGVSSDPAFGDLGATHGGTAQTSWTTGDTLYASATNTLSKRAAGTSGQVFTMSGGVPTWASPAAGGVQYLVGDDTNFESSVGNWGTYHSGTTTPTTLTGGSPSGTFARNTSAPLRGTADGKYTAGAQGDGAKVAFTIDTADKAKPICVALDFMTTGTTTTGDYAIWFEDVTNGVMIQPAPYQLPGIVASTPQRFICYFQTSSNSTSYRMGIHQAVASPGGNLQIDNVTISPTTQTYGAVVTDWVSWTPTGSWVSNVTYTGYKRRVGDYAEYQVKVVCSNAPTSATLTINQPSGETIDQNKLVNTLGNRSVLGFSHMNDSSTSNYFGEVLDNSSTSVLVTYFDPTAAASGVLASVTQAAPFTFGSTDYVDISWRVPIVGWSSNVQVSSDADTRVVAFKGTTTAATSVTSADTQIPFATTVFDTHGKWDGTNTYTVPVPGKYRITCKLAFNSAAWTVGNDASIKLYKNGALTDLLAEWQSGSTNTINVKLQGSTVMDLVAGDTLSIYAACVTTSTLNGSATRNFVCIERISGPAQIAASESVNCRYTNTAGTTLTKSANNTVPFATKDYDSHSAFVTDTFTAPMAGKYAVKAAIALASGATWASGDFIEIDVLKNGSIQTETVPTIFFGTFVGVIGAAVNATVPCVQGDTIKINVFPSKAAAGNVTLSTIANICSVAIDRVGN